MAERQAVLATSLSGTIEPARDPAQGSPAPVLITAAALVVVLSFVVTVGADALWLVALGDRTLDAGHVPAGFPMAAAGSGHWVNVPVLGELVFAAVHRAGAVGLPALQIAIDAVTFGLLACGMRRDGARAAPSALCLAIATIGMLPALAIVRAPTLSLIPFCLVVLLLRAEHERPSRRVWLIPGLIAVWGNLHGAVLVGVSLTCCYLALSRLRRQPLTALAILVLLPVAVCVNPSGVRTVEYYRSIFGSAAVRRGSGLWGPPDLHQPFDVLMLVAAAAVISLLLLRRPPRWECIALLGLAVASLSAGRNGEFLILFAAAPAAVGLSTVRRNPAPATRPTAGRATHLRGRRSARPAGMVPALCVATGLGCAILLVTGQQRLAVNDRRAEAIRSVVGGAVVLAPEPLAEYLAADHVTVWVCDPVDAFEVRDQQAYLDFLAGGGPAAGRALDQAQIVVAVPGSRPAGLATAHGFVLQAMVEGYLVFRRG